MKYVEVKVLEEYKDAARVQADSIVTEMGGEACGTTYYSSKEVGLHYKTSDDKLSDAIDALRGIPNTLSVGPHLRPLYSDDTVTFGEHIGGVVDPECPEGSSVEIHGIEPGDPLDIVNDVVIHKGQYAFGDGHFIDLPLHILFDYRVGTPVVLTWPAKDYTKSEFIHCVVEGYKRLEAEGNVARDSKGEPFMHWGDIALDSAERVGCGEVWALGTSS